MASPYEIILADYEIFLLWQKYEIKFAFKHLRSKYFMRVAYFILRSNISLAVRRILLKKKRQVFRLVFSFSGATDPIRTDDLLITSELLYLLSHGSILTALVL